MTGNRKPGVVKSSNGRRWKDDRITAWVLLLWIVGGTILWMPLVLTICYLEGWFM